MNNAVINKVIEGLESMEKYQEQVGMYGIFFRNKLLWVSKKRVYIRASTAKTRLIQSLSTWTNQLYNGNLQWNDPTRKPWDEIRKMTKEAVEQLIKDGDVEIKKI